MRERMRGITLIPRHGVEIEVARRLDGDAHPGVAGQVEELSR